MFFFPEVIVITTKEVQKALSTDQRLKTDVKMRLDVVCIQEEADMGTADALRHIQQKIKVRQVSIFFHLHLALSKNQDAKKGHNCSYLDGQEG